MENASKALIMAGSVLIAIVILGVLIYVLNSASDNQRSSQKIEVAEQLDIFNKEYEAYNRNLLRGTDIVSVMNKAESNNKKYGVAHQNEPNYLMQIEFEMIDEIQEGNTNLKPNIRYTLKDFLNIKNNNAVFTELKRRVFDCKQIKYHNITGRVYYMLFIERRVDE